MIGLCIYFNAHAMNVKLDRVKGEAISSASVSGGFEVAHFDYGSSSALCLNRGVPGGAGTVLLADVLVSDFCYDVDPGVARVDGEPARAVDPGVDLARFHCDRV